MSDAYGFVASDFNKMLKRREKSYFYQLRGLSSEAGNLRHLMLFKAISMRSWMHMRKVRSSIYMARGPSSDALHHIHFASFMFTKMLFWSLLPMKKSTCGRTSPWWRARN